MPEKQKSLLMALTFCMMIAGLIGYYLHYAYQHEKHAAEDRISATSYLIGEWITGAFAQSDYVLRDITSAVNQEELAYPTLNKGQHDRRIRWLDGKRTTVSHASMLALYDGHCVISHNPNAPEMTGFNASDRDYCKQFHASPDLERWVTTAYVPAGSQKLHVAQFRRIPGDRPELQGLVGFALDLELFSQWIESLQTGEHSVIAIVDTDKKLLARTPSSPESIGMYLGESLPDRLLSGEDKHLLVETTSPVDGQHRLNSLRKVADLPFVIVVGEADSDWLADWWQRVWITTFVFAFLCGVVFLNVREYWKVLRKREDQARFLSMLSHELKTPLSVISMAIGSAQLPAEGKAQINRSVCTMDAVIERCQIAERLNSGQIAVSRAPIDPNALLRNIREDTKTPGRIKLDAPPLPAFPTDFQLLRTVLMNLLDNALKYAPRNASIRLSAQEERHKNRSGIQFDVSNPPGPAGFPDPEQVFRKYYRAPAAHGKSGSGLGLYIAEGLARMLGGELRYRPSTDKVEFSLWIPL